MKFNSLKEFVDKPFKRGGIMVLIYEQTLLPMFKYLEQFGHASLMTIGDKTKKIIGFTVGTRGTIRYKTFYSLKFKVGAESENVDLMMQWLPNVEARWNCGYTHSLRQLIQVSEPMVDEVIENPQSMSPLIYSKAEQEFVNVRCWDFTSFYPYLLTQKLPHFYCHCTRDEMDLNDKRFTYYGGLKIKSIRAKSNLLSISLIGDKNDTNIRDGQGTNIQNYGTRLISADEVIIYGFIPLLLEFLEDYEYESYVVSQELLKFELKINWELRDLILDAFERKQEKKRAGIDYTAEKVLLNRFYGFFITKGTDAPAHFSFYIVEKGKQILRQIALKIGLSDVVQMHTDSLKYVGNHFEIIKEYNDTIEFEELGKFACEPPMYKVYYFGTNKAKYLYYDKKEKEIVLGLKHGGIPERNIKHFYQMDYDDITRDTPYKMYVCYFYDEEYGYIPYQVECNFGGIDNGDLADN